MPPTDIQKLIAEADPDTLPINKELVIEGIFYGTGPQRAEVLSKDLVKLDQSTLLRDSRRFVDFDNGDRYVLKHIFSEDALRELIANPNAHFPRHVAVNVRKAEPQHSIALVRVCDIRYTIGFDTTLGQSAKFDGMFGRGGIADFIDSDGEYQLWNPYIVGDYSNGIGSIGALVAIAFDGERPVYRSQYVAVLRKGILYPDDLWFSSDTHKPFIAPVKRPVTERRFFFQSREPAGGSSDIFVADFNGGHLINLTEDHPDAYDGICLDKDRVIAEWVDERQIAYASMVDGTKRRVVRSAPGSS